MLEKDSNANENQLLLEVLLVQNIHALAEAYGATVIRILTTVQKTFTLD
jgi:hypothetical protein